MDNSKKVQIIGMVWYKEQDYLPLRDIFTDRDKLPTTYSKWLEKANNGFNHFTSKGNIVIKAHIDPKTFPKWCSDRGHSINATGRNEFANFIALEYAKANTV